MSRFGIENADDTMPDMSEADLVEQMIPAGDEDDHDETAVAEPTPMEANEADAVEQRISVPEDEDYPRD